MPKKELITWLKAILITLGGCAFIYAVALAFVTYPIEGAVTLLGIGAILVLVTVVVTIKEEFL